MGILDEAKGIADAVHEVKNLELYGRVLNLHSDIIALVEENNRLRDENKKLAETVALKNKMVFRAPFFYQDGDKIPFCPVCWEKDQRAIHAVFIFDNRERTRWDCPGCKQMFLFEKDRPHAEAAAPEPPFPYRPGDPQGWMR